MARVIGPDSGNTPLPHKSNRAAIHSILVEQLLMHSRKLPRQGVPTISWLASRITIASRLFWFLSQFQPPTSQPTNQPVLWLAPIIVGRYSFWQSLCSHPFLSPGSGCAVRTMKSLFSSASFPSRHRRTGSTITSIITGAVLTPSTRTMTYCRRRCEVLSHQNPILDR